MLVWLSHRRKQPDGECGWQHKINKLAILLKRANFVQTAAGEGRADNNKPTRHVQGKGSQAQCGSSLPRSSLNHNTSQEKIQLTLYFNFHGTIEINKLSWRRSLEFLVLAQLRLFLFIVAGRTENQEIITQIQFCKHKQTPLLTQNT